MTSRFPWGNGAAPALRCDECGKRISKPQGLHGVTESQNLLCGRCLVPQHAGTQCLHAKYYPDCPEAWHDMFDHHISYATRAAAWLVLPDPEKRTA
jgi:hypothetical protein